MLMSRFQIEEYDTVDVDVLRTNRDQIYALELTLDGQVCSGTNCVLAEPNAFGIPVRKAIVKGAHVPFTDQEEERDALLQALRKLYKLASGRRLRMPKSGIGAGPYGLALHSPSIHHDLCQILANHFDYHQPSDAGPHARRVTSTNVAYHHQLFTEVCVGGGVYMAHLVAERHELTMEQLRAQCLIAGNELDAQCKLFPLHRPIYRWARGE
jgi:hypothetical protein